VDEPGALKLAEPPTENRARRVILVALVYFGCASLPSAVFFTIFRDVFTFPLCFPAIPATFLATFAFGLSPEASSATEWMGLLLMAAGAWWLAARHAERSIWEIARIAVVILSLAILIVAAYAYLLAARFRA
jgi:hypothetical protein